MSHDSKRTGLFLGFMVLGGLYFGGPVACGSDSGENGSTTDGGVTLGTDSGPGTGMVSEGDHPDFIAERSCAIRVGCGCTSDMNTCRSQTSQRLASDGSRFRAMGLTYDPSCPTDAIDWLNVRGCNGYAPRDQLTPCPLYHGDLPLGATCAQVSVSVSDCARGLSCILSAGATSPTCQTPPGLLLPGDSCGAPGDEPCDLLNAFCTGAGVCEAFPSVGEACLANTCGLGAYCDETSDICVAALELGAACTESIQCGTRFCDDSVCTGVCSTPL